eukprot:XP_023988740.1 atherin-like [Physeter catodon]
MCSSTLICLRLCALGSSQRLRRRGASARPLRRPGPAPSARASRLPPPASRLPPPASRLPPPASSPCRWPREPAVPAPGWSRPPPLPSKAPEDPQARQAALCRGLWPAAQPRGAGAGGAGGRLKNGTHARSEDSTSSEPPCLLEGPPLAPRSPAAPGTSCPPSGGPGARNQAWHRGVAARTEGPASTVPVTT